MSSVPEPWGTRLVERGFTDRRSPKSQEPSLSALADKLEVNTTTVSETISGKRQATVATVEALMEALGDDVADWLDLRHHGAWLPPQEAALLTPRQRKSLEELIRAIVSGRDEVEPEQVNRRRRGSQPPLGETARDSLVEDGSSRSR